MSELSLALLQQGYNVTFGIVWAWIGAACFALGVLAFSAMGLAATPRSKSHFAVKIFVVLVAMTSYLALALAQGTTIQGQDALFGYARFIDWSITTPLLLLGLALLALPRVRDYPALVLGLLAADLYMILTGLFAGLSGEGGASAWWVWFIVSSIAFVVVYALLWGPLRSAALAKKRSGEQALRSADRGERYEGYLHSQEARLFMVMAAILSVLWLVYPVNYFLGPQGVGAWGLDPTVAIYTVTDVTAKVVYGFVLLAGVLAIERRARKAMDEPPESYMTDSEMARQESEEARRELEGAYNGGGAASDAPRVRRTPRS